MKTINYLKLAIIAIALIVMAGACKSKQQTVAGEVDVHVPCSGVEYFSTPKLIRASAMGQSMDQQVARRSARSAALEDLGSKIGVSVNALIVDYFKSTNQNMTEDLKRRLEGNTDIVIKENISGYRTICERFTRRGENFVCYMAVEIGVDEMVKPLHKRLTDDEILRIDYDFEKFREKFNEEMRRADSNR